MSSMTDCDMVFHESMAYYYSPGKIYVNFHFIRDENGEGNFGPTGDNNSLPNDENNNGIAIANDIVDRLNELMEELLGDPVDVSDNEDYPSQRNLPWRFELFTDPENEEDAYGGIWFWDSPYYDADLNQTNENNINYSHITSQYQPYGNDVLDIYLVEFNQSDDSQVGKAREATLTSTEILNNKGGGVFHFNAWKNYNSRMAQELYSNHWYQSHLLNHEIGHILTGLNHVNDGDYTCDDAQTNDTLTNNVMHAAVLEWRTAWTPCQVNRMFYNFQNSPGRRYYVPADPCSPVSTPLVIDEDSVEFITEVTLDRDIVIEPGADLTVHCKLKMPDHGRILIRSHGKLSLEGATVTSGCEGKLWYGIQVFGNRPNQNGNAQAVFKSNGNSIISYARTALSNPNDVVYTQFKDYSGGGGSMDIRNTTFFNNAVSIFLNPYLITSSGFTPKYPILIDHCTFLTDSSYLTDAPNPIQIIAFGVNGPSIKNSSFHNKRKNVATLPELGVGIYSLGSGFEITGPAQTDRDTLEGYHYGVVAIGSSNALTYSIRNTDFIENAVGVTSEGVDMFSIQNCLFEVGGLDMPPNTEGNDTHEGLAVLTGSAFTITHNNFIGANNGPDDIPPGTYHDPSKWGLRVLNTGTASNRIHNNYFDSLYIGNRAEGLNRNLFDPKIGLMYQCNENVNFRYDFDVHPINSEDGINQNQGSKEKPADNYFTQLQGTYPSDFYNGSDWIVQYWYSTNNSKFKPLDYFSDNNFIPREVTDFEGTCGQIGISEPSDDDIGNLIDQYWSSSDFQDSLETIRQNLIDDGNTSSWLSHLVSTNSTTKGAFLSDLSALSPYTSENLLAAIFERTILFDSAEIHNILIANPHFYLEPTLRESLYMDWGFDEDTLASIFRQNSSSLLELDANISFAVSEKGAALNRILDYYHTDSLDHEAIEYWITLDPNHEYAYMEANLAAQVGNFNKANALTSSISSQYDLTPKLENDLDLYKDWLDIAETLGSQPDSVWHYLQDSSRRDLLEELASAEPCRATAYARGLIYLADRDTIPFWAPIPLDSSIVPRSTNEDLYPLKVDWADHYQMSISPNPVRNDFTFLYPVLEPETDVLTIFSISGDQMWHQPLKRGDQHQFNVSEFSPGIYIGIISNTESSSRHIFRIVKL